MSGPHEAVLHRPGVRILVARPDRIGDVVLSTPVLRALGRALPSASVTVALRALTAPLVRGLEGIDEVLEFDPSGRHAGWKGFFRLVEEIRTGRFDAALVLQSHRKLSLAIWVAGVPLRVGPLSKLHTYLCFNRGLRQRRSRVRMHEADYNLELLGQLGLRVGSREIGPRVACPDAARAAARAWLRTLEGLVAGEGGWVAVHPGMGGSALNWPEERYVELAGALARQGRRVVITGGAVEAQLVARVAERAERPGVKLARWVSGPGQTVVDLAALFGECALVVAPSTGPLHIAVAMGRPVVTFYPRIRVQSPERWGPYFVHGEAQAAVLTPPDARALMDSISLADALAEVEKLVPFRDNQARSEPRQ
ncbi:MAG: glycosyltransferase family 9 protein [Bdellovibrionales bacterium]|nr:glycosyltransferase family 9 protein [Bdellovibrionales bacterium]